LIWLRCFTASGSRIGFDRAPAAGVERPAAPRGAECAGFFVCLRLATVVSPLIFILYQDVDKAAQPQITALTRTISRHLSFFSACLATADFIG
jgi:hypothetical protein